MCGICGGTFEDKKLLKAMASLLLHRGPDESGFFSDKGISLGHRRLSIIDLKTGSQPMSNEDNSVWLVFNGEIFNFHELRDKLAAKHKFSTSSDTESIIHGYEEYGFDVVKHLNGFFAFALWDSKKKLLFIARDRLGIKPLYYTMHKGKFYFASELKALLLNDISRSLNHEALSYFLSFRCNTSSETMLKGFYKLQPGHYLVIKDKKLSIHKYWDISYAPAYGAENFFKDKLLEHLRRSVKMRLMSDVPLGAYISGGIDSAAVTAMMSELSAEPVKTFSVGFDDERYSEIPYAKAIADYFKTDHQEILVRPDTAKLLPKIVWHNDEPMSDPTCIPTYLLSEQTKKKCTVVLTGEGADETLAGYFQYKMMNLYNSYLKRIPLPVRKHIIFSSVNAVSPYLLNKVFKYTSELGHEGKKRFYNYLASNNPAEAYLSMVSIFDEQEKNQSLTQKKGNTIEMAKPYFSSKSMLNNCLFFETKTLLPDNLLMKVDKMTMAFGVEARVPFLDYRLVEFCSSLPTSLKLKGMTEKYLLRKAMKGLIPEAARQRKKERFFVPINSWFQGELMGITKQLLDDNALKQQKIFNPDYIHKVFAGFKSSPLFYSRQLWSLLNFQLWYRQFIESDDVRKVIKY